jgi:hypothetical protein
MLLGSDAFGVLLHAVTPYAIPMTAAASKV